MAVAIVKRRVYNIYIAAGNERWDTCNVKGYDEACGFWFGFSL